MRTSSSGPVVGFDLDMTLVDSAAGIAATLRAVFAELGRELAPERVWPLVGIPLADTIAALDGDLEVEAAADRYRALYREHGLPSIRLLPGADQAIRAVHAAGGRVLVVSAKVEPAVRAVLAHVGLDRGLSAPDVVVGGLFAAQKSIALREYGAQVYVGDHPGDVVAARGAGAVAVAVATGPHESWQLAEAGADVVLPDLTAFSGWLDANLVALAG